MGLYSKNTNYSENRLFICTFLLLYLYSQFRFILVDIYLFIETKTFTANKI